MYGLQQSPKAWNEEFNKFMSSLGFKRSDADECLYIYNSKGICTYLLLYVDDIVLCSKNLNNVEIFKTRIAEKFRSRDLGNVRNFLGLHIDYNRCDGILKINQSSLITNVAQRFRVSNSKQVYSPIESKLDLSEGNGKQGLTKLPYRGLVGCLMYIMLGSRPDICYAISYYAQFMDRATDEHFGYLLRVLEYLVTTKNLALTFSRNNSDVALELYSDANWANCPVTRRSVSGCCAFVYGNLVSWFSRKQAIVTLSSSESELVALCDGSREAIWLKRLLRDLNVNVINNCVIYEDSQSCLKLIKNSNWNACRSKHIDTKFKFVSDLFTNNEFIFEYIPTECQLGDLFTKGIGNVKFKSFVRKLNML